MVQTFSILITTRERKSKFRQDKSGEGSETFVYCVVEAESAIVPTGNRSVPPIYISARTSTTVPDCTVDGDASCPEGSDHRLVIQIPRPLLSNGEFSHDRPTFIVAEAAATNIW